MGTSLFRASKTLQFVPRLPLPPITPPLPPPPKQRDGLIDQRAPLPSEPRAVSAVTIFRHT